MSPVLMSRKERLSEWRDFRRSLTDEKALDKLADFWARCPIVTRSIDPWSSQEWPTAWELLDQGDFCKSGISLGMAYTLVYADPKWVKRVKLELVNYDIDEHLLVIIDNELVLNYSIGEIVNKELIKKYNIKERFEFNGKQFVPGK